MKKDDSVGMADFGATPHVWTSHGGAEETPWQSWWHWSMVSGQDMWSSSHSAETLEEKGWDGGKYQCLMENDGNWMIDITFNDIGDYWLSPCIPHAPKYIYIYKLRNREAFLSTLSYVSIFPLCWDTSHERAVNELETWKNHSLGLGRNIHTRCCYVAAFVGL